VRIGLQSVAHETSPNLPASAGSGSVGGIVNGKNPTAFGKAILEQR